MRRRAIMPGDDIDRGGFAAARLAAEGGKDGCESSVAFFEEEPHRQHRDALRRARAADL